MACLPALADTGAAIATEGAGADPSVLADILRTKRLHLLKRTAATMAEPRYPDLSTTSMPDSDCVAISSVITLDAQALESIQGFGMR